MKSLFLILAMVLMVGFGYGVQPMRKPFIQINIDGKPFKNGDALTIKPGQKFVINTEFEGGRRDFCKFPDTYADIAGTAQILSRGKDGITYQINGKNAEWKLINVETRFSADEFLQINTTDNRPTAEITVSTKNFSQSYIKIVNQANWQFTQDGQVSKEANVAEATIYIKVEGQSDIWFSAQNIQASGIKNELVQEKLNGVQLVCDSIERSFYRLNFNAVQQSVRDLQNAVNMLKSTLDEVQTTNPAYQAKILFIGLPSDNPYKDINLFLQIKNSWATLETLVNTKKQLLSNLTQEPSKENKDQLMQIILGFVDWEAKLPENLFKVLPRYVAEINESKTVLPENIQIVAKGKTISDYPQTIANLNTFIDQRIQDLPLEIQRINSAQVRLQAVKLFDGMLRSYFSSISWADWKNTRE